MNIAQNQIASRPVVTPIYKLFRLGIIVGGRVVEELTCLPGKTVTIGTLPGNDIQIADSANAPLSLILVHYQSGDKCQMRLSNGMTARMATQRGIQEIDAQMDGKMLSLDPCADRGKIVFDNITLIFQFVDAPGPIAVAAKRATKQFERKGVLGKCISVLCR